MIFPDEPLSLGHVREIFTNEVNSLDRRLNLAAAPAVLAGVQARARSLAKDVRGFKIYSHKQRDDQSANLLLGMQAHASAIAAEAKMWQNLRRSKSHDAWCDFVDAEEWFALAHRTDHAEVLAKDAVRRHQMIQDLVFPHMMFVSSGIDHGPGKCTICAKRFGSCDHLKGGIYFGQVCAEYGMKEMRADHVAMVTHPHDKRCYVVWYTNDQGDKIDRVTGAVTKRNAKDPVPGPGEPMQFQSVVFRNSLPFGARL